jgi:hypothetical protein
MRKPRWVLTLAGAASFMVSLDALVVTTALPGLRVAAPSEQPNGGDAGADHCHCKQALPSPGEKHVNARRRASP